MGIRQLIKRTPVAPISRHLQTEVRPNETLAPLRIAFRKVELGTGAPALLTLHFLYLRETEKQDLLCELRRDY
jgi:hypothetical protein